jgi:hypothetical protein
MGIAPNGKNIKVLSSRYYILEIIEKEIEDEFKNSTIKFLFIFQYIKDQNYINYNYHFINYNSHNANEIVRNLQKEYSSKLFNKKDIDDLARNLYDSDPTIRLQAFIGWKKDYKKNNIPFYYFNYMDYITEKLSNKISVAKYLWSDYNNEEYSYESILYKYFCNIYGDNFITFMALLATTIFSINKPFFKEFKYPAKYNTKFKLNKLTGKMQKYIKTCCPSKYNHAHSNYMV